MLAGPQSARRDPASMTAKNNSASLGVPARTHPDAKVPRKRQPVRSRSNLFLETNGTTAFSPSASAHRSTASSNRHAGRRSELPRSGAAPRRRRRVRQQTAHRILRYALSLTSTSRHFPRGLRSPPRRALACIRQVRSLGRTASTRSTLPSDAREQLASEVDRIVRGSVAQPHRER
jgi:hypothetical protein